MWSSFFLLDTSFDPFDPAAFIVAVDDDPKTHEARTSCASCCKPTEQSSRRGETHAPFLYGISPQSSLLAFGCTTNAEVESVNVLVFGASGATGREVVKHALDRGHSVSAFVRDPDKFEIEHANLLWWLAT